MYIKTTELNKIECTFLKWLCFKYSLYQLQRISIFLTFCSGTRPRGCYSQPRHPTSEVNRPQHWLLFLTSLLELILSHKTLGFYSITVLSINVFVVGRYKMIRLSNCTMQLGIYDLELGITQINHLQTCKLLKCYQEQIRS